MTWGVRCSEKWFQVVCSTILAGTLLGTGAVIGWSGVVAVLVQDDGKIFNLTAAKMDWLVSSAGGAAVVSSLFSGYLMDIIGPCRVVHFFLVPAAFFWIVMTSSTSYGWLLIGRIVTGAVTQIQMTAVQPLIAEMCQPEIRGMMAIMPEFWVSLGVLILCVCNQYLTWQASTLVAGTLVLPSIVAMLFVPESHYWYLRKGNYKEAQRSLRKLRSPLHDVDSELNGIRDALGLHDEKRSFLDQLKALREPENYRPTIVLVILFILRELGGAVVIFTYASLFFDHADLLVKPFTAAALLGVTRLIFTLVSAGIIDKVGRRSLFVASSLICSAAMFTTGITIPYVSTSPTWIPLAAVFIYVASYSLGAGPIPWVLTGEMLPTNVRLVSASLCSFVVSLLLFLHVRYMPDLLAHYGLDKVAIGFASFHLLGGAIAWLCLPETRCRTLEELQTSYVGADTKPFRPQQEGYTQAYGATYENIK